MLACFNITVEHKPQIKQSQVNNQKDSMTLTYQLSELLQKAVVREVTVSSAIPQVDNGLIPTTERIPCLQLGIFAYKDDLCATFIEFAKRAAMLMGMKVEDEIIRLPYAWEKWAVLKSPHVDKKHWSQFERRTHRRILQVHNASLPLLEKWIWYLSSHLPSQCWILAKPAEFQAAIWTSDPSKPNPE